jgi:hypothetical protein
MPFQARLYKNQSPQALSTIAVSPGDTFELILCGLTSLYQNAVVTFSCKPGSFKNNLTAIANDLPAFPSTSSLSVTLPGVLSDKYTIDLVPTQTSALTLNTTYALELQFLLTTGEIESWQFVFKTGQDIVGNTTPATAGVNNRRNLGNFTTAPIIAQQGDCYYNTTLSKFYERINGVWTEYGSSGGGATNLSYTASPTQGQVNSDTGTDAVIPATDGTNAGLFLPSEKTKLTGIATNATANSSDPFLLNRNNHTGTQSISTIINLQSNLDSKQNTITNSDSITQGSTNLFLTTAERTKLSNTTNTNTGDETTGSILNKIGNGATIDDNYIPNSIARDLEILTKTLDTTFVPTNSAIVLGNTILQSLEKAQGQINNKENTITAGTTSQYYRGDKTFQTLDKTAVGLANVDNTSDLNKPISTATQTGLDAKANITGQVFTGNIQTPQINTSKQTLTPTGTTQSINWNNGSIIDLVLSSATGNVTLTLLNAQNSSSYLIEVTNGATPRNLIFPIGTLQSNGGGNVYVGIANQKDVIAVLWDGTQFLISVSRNFS